MTKYQCSFANGRRETTWTIPPEAHRFLQKVTSQVNRSKPSEENLVGDLSRTILLKATVKEVRNQFPIDIGIDIQGLVPTQLTSAGRHNYVIFADTKPTLVNEDISAPEHIFNKDSYIKYGKLTPEALKKEISFPIDDHDCAEIRIGGIAWDLLLKNAEAGHFEDDVAAELLKVGSKVHENPFMRKVQIPKDIGQELFTAIGEPLKEIDKSFVDLRRTQVRFTPVQSPQWNSFESLIGDSVGLASEDNEALAHHQLTTERLCSAKIEISYVCF